MGHQTTENKGGKHSKGRKRLDYNAAKTSMLGRITSYRLHLLAALTSIAATKETPTTTPALTPIVESGKLVLRSVSFCGIGRMRNVANFREREFEAFAKSTAT